MQVNGLTSGCRHDAAPFRVVERQAVQRGPFVDPVEDHERRLEVEQGL